MALHQIISFGSKISLPIGNFDVCFNGRPVTLLRELNVTLFDYCSNHVGWHFPVFEYSLQAKVLGKYFNRTETQSKKGMDVVDYSKMKSEIDLKSELEKAIQFQQQN